MKFDPRLSFELSSSRAIGVIGGVGPVATARLYTDVVTSHVLRTRGSYPHIVIDSLPLRSELQHAFVSGRPSPRAEAEIIELLQNAAQRLVRAGAATITLPCNTLHAYLHRIVPAERNALSMVEHTVRAAQRRGWRQIALLGTSSTKRVGIYERWADVFGLSISWPSEADQVAVNQAILRYTFQSDPVRLLADLGAVVGRLAATCDGLVVACTDLTDLRGYQFEVPVLDSLSVLADACSTWLLPSDTPLPIVGGYQELAS